MKKRYHSDEENDGSEALIEDSRRMVRRGAAQYSSDISEQADYDQLSQLLGMTWLKGCQLNMLAVGRHDELTGQAGLIDYGDGKVVIVTALHNLVERNFSRPFSAALKIPGPIYDQSFQAEFAEMGKKDPPGAIVVGNSPLEGTGFWEYGLDITIGSLYGALSSQAAQSSFEVVPRGTLPSLVGRRIAMAIFARRNATQETASTSLDQDKIDEIFGVADEVNFFTGTLVAVSERFIFHDINSYRGCSGATLFLLDGEHQGKAFAVHVGCPKGINPKSNMGVDIWARQEQID